MLQASRSAALALVACIAIVPHALAQCPGWQHGFTQQGLDGYPRVSAGFDDGSGPELFVGGSGLYSGAWNGSSAALFRLHDGRWTPVPGTPSPANIDAITPFDAAGTHALCVAGSFGGASRNVAAWNGAAWIPLGTGTNGEVFAALEFDDGSGRALYVAGSFTNADGIANTSHVARWRNGSWEEVGGGIPDASAYVAALCAYDDGTGPALYAAGAFTHAGSAVVSNVAKWDGSHWSAIPGGTDGLVTSLAVYDDGNGPRLYVGGEFVHAGGTVVNHIASWDGAAWSTLAGGLNLAFGYGAWIQSMVVVPTSAGSRLCIAGAFYYAGSVATPLMALWDGSTWSPFGSTINDSTWIDIHLATFDDGSGPKLVACGDWEVGGPSGYWATGTQLHGVILWDGTVWHALGMGEHGAPFDEIEALCVHDDGSGPALYASGRFMAAGDVEARGVARFDGQRWSRLKQGIWNFIDTTDYQYAGALASYGPPGSAPHLFVGGHFSQTGVCLWEWDGSQWTHPITNMFGHVSALCTYDDGSGPALFAAGAFTINYGAPLQIVKLQGGTHSVLPALTNTPPNSADVDALCTYDDGTGPKLYAAGRFTQAGGVPANFIASWDGTQWRPLGRGLLGPPWQVRVNAMIVHDDGTGPSLFVGGYFYGAGAADAVFLARWDGSQWHVVGNGTSDPVTSFARLDDGTGTGTCLFVGGEFTSCDGLAVQHLAKWDGSSWHDAGGGANGRIAALATFGDGAQRSLYIGGRFQRANGVPSQYFARWTACDGLGTIVCSGNGAGAGCPCGNASGPSDGVGCLNSGGVGGSLRARGESRLGNDSVTLVGTQMTSSTALYFQGSALVAGGSGAVFGDGLRCVGGSLTRIATVPNTTGSSQYPRAGDPSLSARGGVASPGTRHYQVRYRDAATFCTIAGFDSTNAVSIVWAE